MDDDLYTCEDCDRTFEHEDEGRITEAGFECFECENKRWDEAYSAYLASKDAQIRRNYPDLDRHVKMAEADPAGFYHACKNNPESLYE